MVLIGFSMFFFSFYQLMWIAMLEILWRLPRSFNFILLVCNVRIGQQKLKCLERYADKSEILYLLQLETF